MLILALASCAKGPETKTETLAGNIVNGFKSKSSFEKSNGLVALIIQDEEGSGLCSGTLISKQIVLTAAHCLAASQSKILSISVIFAQDISKAKKEQIRYGVTSRVHELFLTTAGGLGSWNDIALIKLNEDAPSDIKFARLPSLVSLPVEAGTMLIQAGYGKTEASKASTKNTSGVLRQVPDIELLRFQNNAQELRVKEDGKGSCNGDSGGPAFTRSSDGTLTQVGINSRGTEALTCIGEGIYTSVQAHLQWIATASDSLMKESDVAPNAE